MKMETITKNYAAFFESITQETPIESYAEIFDEKIYFEDPFQKVIGLTKVYEVFQHMFDTLYHPRFIIEEIICNQQCAYLRWTFSYQRSSKHKVEKFTGVSRVQFLQTGKVISHIDYWDAAEHIYEKVPLLGALLRMIKKRIRA
ncbi:nuclear transport factor 2 family protein [Campylobacterota bacterium]